MPLGARYLLSGDAFHMPNVTSAHPPGEQVIQQAVCPVSLGAQLVGVHPAQQDGRRHAYHHLQPVRVYQLGCTS
jgi:hypothetical protein